MNGADNPQNSCQYCDYNANPTGWTNKSNGATCDDGNSCTVMDQCMAGQCTGQQKDCDDGLSCTMDTCNESNGGQCEHTVTTGCAVNGTCYADGEAQPGAPCQVCDPNQSTTSFVTAAPGTSCDDGLFCTVNDQCNMNGNCVSGGQRNCEGTLPQDIVVCNNTFQCSESLDKCNFSDAKSNGTPCDDGNACTSSTTCQGGVCTGMTKDCSLEMPDPCREGVCNPDDGTCEVENVDTTCNGGLYQCQSGSCPDACTSDADCGEGAVCCTAERPCDPDPNDGDFECTADNLPPTANAGMDQQGISEGASVTLSGSQSSDPDGDDIESYSWSLIEVRCDAGTADVATMRTRLMNENDDWEMQTSSEQLTFTAPRPQCEGLTLIFQLVVSDGETQSNPDNDQNATVEVMYGEVDNNAPFARITGPPQADCGESVTLSGSESTDVDGDTLQYTWSVRSGEPAPQLSSMMGESIQVTIPNSVPSDTLYEISLTVFDGFVNSEPDVQVIAVDACEIGGDAGMGDAGAVDAGEGLPDGEPGGSGCLSSTTGQPGVPGALLGLLVGGVAIGVRRRRS